MNIERLQMSIQTIKDNIKILESQEPEDAGYYLQLEHEKMALDALEKQMPIKPIGKHTSYKCPVCNRRVRSGKGSSSFGVDHFCQRCGQALDWRETE